MPHAARRQEAEQRQGVLPAARRAPLGLGLARSWLGQGSAGAQGNTLLLGNTLQQLP